MDIVEKEAVRFSKPFLKTTTVNNLKNFKERLDTKLYEFTGLKNKRRFLTILRKIVLDEKNEFERKYSSDSHLVNDREIALFAIDEQIEYHQSDIEESDITDPFSPAEQSEQYQKINEVLDKLEKLGLGQEIIFAEIEELKDHMNLGKKNWVQLLAGKMFEVSLTGLFDKTIVQSAYEALSKGLRDAPSLLNM